jgi:cell wall-associated NlpC family hydrolase
VSIKGSRLSGRLLLEASSIADFSDRIEFMGQLAQADADLATTASNKQTEALWLADELEKTVEERRTILQDIERKQAEIRSLIAQAQTTYEELGRKYRDALAAERAAAVTAAEAQARSDITTGIAPGPVPVVSGSVDAVIAAARSVIGIPYIFGAADPAVGFDCSGLTMWAWAHAGVSLPHSSSLQYASLPPIDSSALQPGDLVFSSYGRPARESSITSLSTSARVRPSRRAVPARLSGTGPSPHPSCATVARSSGSVGPSLVGRASPAYTWGSPASTRRLESPSVFVRPLVDHVSRWLPGSPCACGSRTT